MGLDKNQIAKRIAQELKDGYYVNLGIGIPTLVANFVPEDIHVTLPRKYCVEHFSIKGDRAFVVIKRKTWNGSVFS